MADLAEEPRIAPRLARADMAKLKADLTERLCAASGGPCRPEMRKPQDTSLATHLSDTEFAALQAGVARALAKLAAPPAETHELLSLLTDARPGILILPQ